MFQFGSTSKTARGVFGLFGAVVAATIAWIMWAFLAPGDFFGNGSALVVPSLLVSAVCGFSVGIWQKRRLFRVGIGAGLFAAAGYWIFVPDGWWATPPPGGIASTEPGIEGVYCTGSEIGGFSGTVLELRDGRFRYWFYSDVVGPNEPHLPVIGDYSMEGEKVVLRDNRVNPTIWNPDTVNGIRVLWRDDGLKVWRDQRKIYDYSVLIKTDATIPKNGMIEGPSIRSLYDARMRRRVPVWKDPFVYGPQ
jgi:hypothetical protein